MTSMREKLRLTHNRYQAALALMRQQDLMNTLGARVMVTAADRHQLILAQEEYDAATFRAQE